MNKNKIFKNLKKLTAVSLTAANLFTFANSGSATIVTRDGLTAEQKTAIQTLFQNGKFETSIKNLGSNLYGVMIVDETNKICVMRINQKIESKSFKNQKLINSGENLVVYTFSENFLGDKKRCKDALKEYENCKFISLEEAKEAAKEEAARLAEEAAKKAAEEEAERKAKEEKKEEKKEEEEATPGANNTQNNQEKPKKGSFVSRHKELISGGLIGTGVLTIVASAVTIFWNEVKTGCNFVAEKAVELKNKIVKAVK